LLALDYPFSTGTKESLFDPVSQTTSTFSVIIELPDAEVLNQIFFAQDSNQRNVSLLGTTDP
jgi:hypothetical protein